MYKFDKFILMKLIMRLENRVIKIFFGEMDLNEIIGIGLFKYVFLIDDKFLYLEILLIFLL